MKLKEIITLVEWNDIEEKMIELYPDEKDIINGYKLVFNKLVNLESVETDLILTLEKIPPNPPFNDEEYVDVTGEGVISEDDLDDDDPGMDYYKVGDKINYAIKFVPWSKWIDMQINEDTLRNFTYEEIVTHSLWEITFDGFEEEEKQDHIKEIKDTVDKIKNGEIKTKELNIKDLLGELEKD